LICSSGSCDPKRRPGEWREISASLCFLDALINFYGVAIDAERSEIDESVTESECAGDRLVTRLAVTDVHSKVA
jgi:hypothetical protein